MGYDFADASFQENVHILLNLISHQTSMCVQCHWIWGAYITIAYQWNYKTVWFAIEFDKDKDSWYSLNGARALY